MMTNIVTQTKKNDLISTEKLSHMINGQRELLIVDVRTPREYETGHIEGSRLLPLAQLTARFHELPRDRPVILTCLSGSRSGVACERLSAMGFTNIANLQDGIGGWKRAGLPIVK